MQTNQPTNLNARPTEEMVLQTRYDVARKNLLFVVVFSLINLILLLTDSTTYFLFSAYIPYILASTVKYLCGMYPADYYDFDYAEGLFFPAPLFWGVFILSLLIVGFYVLCFIFSAKNRGGWLIAALVLFALDTAVMFYINGISVDMIMDIILHAWVIVTLSVGVHAHFKRKKLAENRGDPADADAWSEPGETDAGCLAEDAPVCRAADFDVKHRVLLQTELLGHTVIYRRVGKTNELVIDGLVYDDYTASMELPHELVARVDGHEFTAGLMRGSRSYITVDGEIVAKKMRWI
ncbi:MAG: hypothetical protein IJZ02_05535 [Clostridia bacterium]|nr:hypothetical protein [Clostridia bacterium]